MDKPIRYKSRNSGKPTLILLLVFLAFCMVGCAHTGIRIEPVSNTSMLELSPDDVVAVMRRAGFSDDQILEYGPAIRNNLAQSGAVQVRVGKKVEVIFAIKNESVYIVTRLRGNFIYSPDTGWIGSGG